MKRSASVIVGSLLMAKMVIACVDDSATMSPEAGADAATDSVVAADVATDTAAPDAGTDTAIPKVMCDVTKAFGAPTLVTVLVSGQDSVLRFTADEAMGFFLSARDGGVGGNDIWSTARSAGGAFSAISDVPVINSASSENEPTISGDGKTIVFSSDQPGSQGLDLWVASRSTLIGTFSAPTLVANVNTTFSEITPFLREDGQVLYLTSDRTPTQGQSDIWRAVMSGSSFGAPTHVDELGSAGNDGYPAVTPDDLVMYFSSSRTPTLGGMDVWVTTRATASGPFGAPKAVPELSTASNDLVSFVSTDRCRVYLSSNVGGQYEIYLATRTP